MKKLILSIIIISFSFCASAQNDSIYTPSKHFFGLNIGSTTGIGLSYRYWPTRLGAQITAAPIILPNNKHFISLGFSALLKFKETKNFTIYGYLSDHALIINNNEPINNIGIGGGFKYVFFETLEFNLQVGYGVYSVNTDDINSKIAGEISIYYQL